MPEPSPDSFSREAAEAVDLVVSPRLLLPVAPRNEALEGMSVAVGGGAIVELGSRHEVLARNPGARHLELGNQALMPGLVNAHGHLAMALLRGLGESESLDDWLNNTIWPLEARWMDEDFVRDGTRLAVAEMVATGTTTASDMYYFPETAALACRGAGFRLQATFPLIEIPNAYSADFDECLSKGLALHDRFRGDDLVTTCFGPHSAYTVDPARLRRVAVLADEIDADVHIHLHETEDEVAGALRSQGGTWIRVLDEVGLLTERLQAVHMTAVSDAEIDLVSERGVRIVHCPHSNMKLASGICPVTKFLASGATVGLGTDGAASNNALDMFAEARLAALLAKSANADPTVLPAADIIAMATLGGARTIGLGDRIGSIEVGKRADLVAIDLDHPTMQPVNDPHAALVHADAGARVTHTFIDGQCVYENGAWNTLDIDEVLARAGAWRAKLNG
ncbi:MAG: amidohydrolase family protein [Gammaproteobacteria bacterium]|nr:amidohydrolase family protein [Gammaproteobacteria bacterium]